MEITSCLKYGVFSCLLSVCRAQVETRVPHWPKIHIRLSAVPSLKELFDQGLRPQRASMNDTLSLALKHLRVVLQYSDAPPLPEFAANLVEITVTNTGRLSSLRFYGYSLTIPECKEFVKSWQPFSAEGFENPNTLTELENIDQAGGNISIAFENVSFGNVYLKYPKVSGITFVENETHSPGHSVSFRESRDTERPFIPHYQADWSSIYPRRKESSYSIPIPAPPGYEDVEMNPPQTMLIDDHFEREKQFRLGEEFLTIKEQSTSPERLSNVQAGETAQNAPKPQTSEKNSWWKWLLVLLAIAVLVRQTQKQLQKG